jgi:hypothetical protein
VKVELERTLAALRALPGARIITHEDAGTHIVAVLDYRLEDLLCRSDGTFRVTVHSGLPGRYDAWEIDDQAIYYDGTEEGTRYPPSWLFFDLLSPVIGEKKP